MKGWRLLARYWRRVNLDRRYVLTAGGLALGYLVAAKFGLSLAQTTKQITTVWPPTGIALVAMLTLGYRYWPGVWLGALAANLGASEPLPVALGVALGNTLEAVVGAYLLRRVAGFGKRLRNTRDAVALFGLGGLVSTMVAATIGTASLAAGGLVAWHAYGPNWLVWWLGDMAGDLLVAPFLLICLSPAPYAVLKGRGLEGGLTLAGLLAVSVALFTGRSPETPLLLYLLFPLMVWLAIRFTQFGVATGAIVVAAAAIWATTSGQGPFAAQLPLEQSLIQLQLFVFVISATSLLLAMAVTERLAAETALRRQAHELRRLEAELKEANKRVTNILAGVLDGEPKRRER